MWAPDRELKIPTSFGSFLLRWAQTRSWLHFPCGRFGTCTTDVGEASTGRAEGGTEKKESGGTRWVGGRHDEEDDGRWECENRERKKVNKGRKKRKKRRVL
jgi:hypothetical protein